MSKQKDSDTRREQRLVRVAGRGKKDQMYDSYGHEVSEQLPQQKPKQRVHGSRTEEVKRSIEQEQEERRARREKNQEDSYSGYDEISNPELRKDKVRSYQQRKADRKEAKRIRLLGALRVGIFLMCIGILILVVLLSGKLGNRVNTQYIHRGSIDVSATGTLSFLRNEIPVKSSRGGTFIAYVNEGDRVAKDALLGYVVQPGYESQLAKLRAIEAKLTSVNQALSYINTTKSPELLIVEEGIAKAIASLSQMAMRGDLTGYSECAKELNLLYQEKNEILMNTETTDSYLQGLQNQRNDLLAEIQASMHPVVAEESGIVSFCTDGQETVVSNVCDALQQQISATDFNTPSSCKISDDTLNRFALPADHLEATNGRSVTAGTVVARITPDIAYYITMDMTSADGYNIVPGDTITVRVKESSLSFQTQVCGLYKGESKHLLVLSCSNALMATISDRQVSGEIVFSQTDGLKVPLRALTEWDEAGVTARITVVRSGYVEYVYVNVLATDHDYAIINSKAVFDDGDGISVRENDEYVVDYEKVQEGQAL